MQRLEMHDAPPRAGVPVIVLASLATAFSACSNDNLPAPDAGVRSDVRATGGAGGGDGTDANDASAGTGGAVPPISTEPDARVVDVTCLEAGTSPDPRYEWANPREIKPCCGFFIDLPPEGTPALLEAMCLVGGDGAITSGWAARATLLGAPRYSTAGTIEIARGLAAHVVGVPTVTLVDALPSEWGEILLTSVRAKSFGGFEFDASWPNGHTFRGSARLTLEVTFVVRCSAEGGPPDGAPQTTRTVKALTHLDRCGSPIEGTAWTSSGDACNLCPPQPPE